MGGGVLGRGNVWLLGVLLLPALGHAAARPPALRHLRSHAAAPGIHLWHRRGGAAPHGHGSHPTGTVAVWNLLTKSLLQCVHQPDGSLKLYPFRCFLAHDHAVRSMEWCKADSNFLVTAGSDRKIKFWDLRRPYEPINSIKRFLSTEVAWLLPYNGVTVAQDNCYASYGLCGIHYIDAGYLGFKAYFVAPRKGTVWVRGWCRVALCWGLCQRGGPLPQTRHCPAA
ncbi:general transcription factor 3C polypeptide 2 [Egretta garzetta]|uniref:general transcription factor 3C polypeptide 2 n=1 Tax=Egretta garzetta TaxID=188379 RepID=UPI00163C69E3|nr:general transcription factor 3C polypeptide 2 [Egretta garzetta]